MQAPRPGIHLITERLSPAQARLAFALMQLTHPELTMDLWLAYTRRLAARHGVLIARRPMQPHICGAVCFHRDRDPFGHILTAENLVACDLLYPEHVAASLAQALRNLAQQLGCARIRLLQPPPVTTIALPPATPQPGRAARSAEGGA